MAMNASQAVVPSCESYSSEQHRSSIDNTPTKSIDQGSDVERLLGSTVIQEVTSRLPEIISERTSSSECSGESMSVVTSSQDHQHFSEAVSVLQQQFHSLPPSEHLQEVSSLQKQVRSWHPVLKPPPSLTPKQVTAMFNQYYEQPLDSADVAEIVSEVTKYGWSLLSEGFTLLFQSQCSLSMSLLLEQLLPLRSTLANLNSSVFASASVAATKQVPHAAWDNLLRQFVSRILQSTTPSSRAYRSYFAFSDAHTNDEWLTVGSFVATHCSVQSQEAVAAHLGTVLSLYTLNYLVTHLPAEGVPDGPLQERLRHCAVEQCATLSPPLCDVKTVVEWVVRGHYTELLRVLGPVLQASAELIVEPAMRQELAKETLMSYELRKVVHTRIASLQPLTVVPPLCWRLPPDHLHCTVPAVCAFLASEQQSIELSYRRFGKKTVANRWAKAFRSRFVSAIAARGVVIITKNDSAHQAAVKRCAECKKEILNLNKLLYAE